jgi:hypothetical protein
VFGCVFATVCVFAVVCVWIGVCALLILDANTSNKDRTSCVSLDSPCSPASVCVSVCAVSTDGCVLVLVLAIVAARVDTNDRTSGLSLFGAAA